MSIDWACHYRKNTPGYLNPWEGCQEEILAMLVCPEPTYVKALNIDFSGYTLGVPEGWIPDSNMTYYGGSSGLFETRITTGVDNTPISGASGILNLYLGTGIGNQKSILSSGFQVDANGYYSGNFTVPIVTGTAAVKGSLFAFSGLATGLLNLDMWIIQFENPTLQASFSAISNSASVSLTNNNARLSVSGFIEKSIDFGQTYSIVHSYEIGPTENSGFSEDIGGDWVSYLAYITPYGFSKSLPAQTGVYDSSGNLTGYIVYEPSGGHPPAALSMDLIWSYDTINDPTSSHLFLKIDVDPTKIGLYLDTNAFDSKWSTDEVTWNDFFIQTTSVGDKGAAGLTNDYFLQRAQDLDAAGTYYVRTSGKRQEQDGVFYSQFLSGGPFIVGGITAYAETSPQGGCGIDVRWEGVNLGEYGYIVNYSGQGEPTDNGTANPQWMGYHYDSSNYCGRIYSFQISNRYSPDIKSDWVSGSGVMTLLAPHYTIKAVYTSDTPERPTTNFSVVLDWSDSSFYDSRAEYLTGYRTYLSDPSFSNVVGFKYSETTEVTDSPGNGFPLLKTVKNVISYNMRLVSGIGSSYPIFGDYVARTMDVGRQPDQPTITSITNNGNNVTVNWEGTASETPYESYILHRRMGENEVTFNFNNATTSYSDELLPAGTYDYFVETISKPNSSFTAVSDFSPTSGIVVS